MGYAMRIDENDEVKLFAAELGEHGLLRGMLDFFQGKKSNDTRAMYACMDGLDADNIVR